jgi:hypothetical protein
MTLKEAVQLKIGDVIQFEMTHCASIPENKWVDTKVEVVTEEYQYSKKIGGWGVKLKTLGITCHNCHNFRYFKKLA